jgi:hypothetical protein
VHQTGSLAVEQDAQSVEIETWRVVGTHSFLLHAGKLDMTMMPTSRYVVQRRGET